MRLSYRNSEVHAALPPSTGIASVAHVFADEHSPHVFAFCEMADGSTFWCNKPEDSRVAPLALMFWMQPADPWIAALETVPVKARIQALLAHSKKGGAV